MKEGLFYIAVQEEYLGGKLDDLEEEYSFGFYGGARYHFSSSMIFNIEGQVGNRKSILGSLEYRF